MKEKKKINKLLTQNGDPQNTCEMLLLKVIVAPVLKWYEQRFTFFPLYFSPFSVDTFT